MNKDEIFQMARDSGIEVYGLGRDRTKFINYLERFAKLVAQNERESCAKICDDDVWRCKKIAVDTQNKQANASAIEATICASAIRVRGQE
jgi:hypothetical protein